MSRHAARARGWINAPNRSLEGMAQIEILDTDAGGRVEALTALSRASTGKHRGQGRRVRLWRLTHTRFQKSAFSGKGTYLVGGAGYRRNTASPVSPARCRSPCWNRWFTWKYGTCATPSSPSRSTFHATSTSRRSTAVPMIRNCLRATAMSTHRCQASLPLAGRCGAGEALGDRHRMDTYPSRLPVARTLGRSPGSRTFSSIPRILAFSAW